jgi:hypothetical protein
VYGAIDLTWLTASELNNSGFYVNRSTSLDGTKTQIQVYNTDDDTTEDFIPSTSGGVSGMPYEVYDENVSDNITYYYWLESVDTSGSVTFSDPISATTLIDPDSTLTATSATSPTATPTRTPTSTPTATPTSTLTPNPANTSTVTVTPGGPTSTSTPTLIATPTRTRAPTLTPNYSFQPTIPPLPVDTLTPPPATPGTIVPTGTVTSTSTATLEPLPSITLLFPLVTDTGTPTPPDPAALAQSPQDPSSTSQNTGLSPDIMVLIGAIIAIWLLLGAFLFLYIRRIGTGS